MTLPSFAALAAPADWAAETTPRSVSVTVLAGDVLVVSGFTADSDLTLGFPTGGGLTFTDQRVLAGVAGFTNQYCWTATAGAAATFDVTVASTGTPTAWNFAVSIWRGSDGIGASSKVQAAGAPSLGLTTTYDNSAILFANSDWNGVDGAGRAYLTVNGAAPTERAYTVNANYGIYLASYADAGVAGAKTVGLSAPAGQTYSAIALELRGTTGTTPPVGTSFEFVGWGIPIAPTAGTAGTGGSGGSGGLLTDRLDVAYTSPSTALSSRYHIWAAGLPATRPLPLLVHFHGDDAFEFLNPTSTFSFGGTNGMIAKAKENGYLMLAALTPDVVGSETWWESGDNLTEYARDLIQQAAYDRYDIDLDNVWLVGYSGGAQFITQFFLPQYAGMIRGGGALIFGGGDVPLVAVSPPWTAGFKANFKMTWCTGVADNGYNGYDAHTDAVNGRNYYAAAGFTTTLLEPAGQTHDNIAFGTITDQVLSGTVAPPAGVAPVWSSSQVPGGTVGTAFSFTFVATGPPTPTYSVTSGTLPAGLSMTTGGVLSGTPTTAASYSFTVTAANGTAPNATAARTVVIAAVTPPSTGTIFGPLVDADTKDNIGIGPNKLGYRFRAATSSTLTGVRFTQRSGPGIYYSQGNFGTMTVQIRPDDGAGHPHASTVLATMSFVPSGSNSVATEVFALKTFTGPASLTAGTVYWVVFTGSSTSNFLSVNMIYKFNHTTPRNPGFADADFGVTYTSTGTWGAVNGGDTPVLDLVYGNGVVQGNPYYECMILHYAWINGTAAARERFTVSGGSKTVTRANVRVRRSSGSSPLILSLVTTGAGPGYAETSVIESVSIPAASVPVSTPGGDNGGAVWVGANFTTARTLTNGANYALKLTTSSGTTYSTAGPLRQSKDGVYLYSSAGFPGGSGQSASSGSNWVDCYQFDHQDLQFYLTLA